MSERERGRRSDRQTDDRQTDDKETDRHTDRQKTSHTHSSDQWILSLLQQVAAKERELQVLIHCISSHHNSWTNQLVGIIEGQGENIVG